MSDIEKLLREEQSLGWDLARARAHNGAGSAAATAEPAQDPDYRFAVVQSEMYRRHLKQAVERLDGILELADAVMVARGDLGVELPPQAVPPLQKMIVEAARRMGRPVVKTTGTPAASSSSSTARVRTETRPSESSSVPSRSVATSRGALTRSPGQTR